jgi:glycolate oxidase FAD binding subunit
LDNVIKELINIVGESNLLTSDLDLYMVEGQVPKAVVFPGTVQEISEILALADKEGVGVIPRGSGTKMYLGGIPKRVDLVLSLTRLNQILEYEAADLTVMTQAGITLADLQSTLAQRGQFLALDPPFASKATIGGILSTNSSGPCRLLYGTARDLVIGIKVVHPGGMVTKGGGKVVKNVAGYDMNKLYIGALGTLGVIVEANFKLRPLPRMEKSLWAAFPSLSTAFEAVTRIFKSELNPAFLELFNPSAGALLSQVIQIQTPENNFIVAMGADEVPEAVERQVTQAERFCKESGATDTLILAGEVERKLRGAIREFFTLVTTHTHTTLGCKVSTLPKTVEELFQMVDRMEKRYEVPVLLQAHAGNGIVYIYFSRPETPVETFVKIIEELRTSVVNSGGNLVVELAPIGLKERIEVWGDPGSSFRLMRGIKAQFDPHNILNPGRFVGGL